MVGCEQLPCDIETPVRSLYWTVMKVIWMHGPACGPPYMLMRHIACCRAAMPARSFSHGKNTTQARNSLQSPLASIIRLVMSKEKSETSCTRVCSYRR